MANVDAFNEGFDMGSGKSGKKPKKQGDKNGAGDTANVAKKTGGGIFGKIMHVLSPISNFDKGGRVKKTGVYRLKKNELVLTAKQQKAAGLKKRKSKAHSRKRVASKG